MGLGSGILFRTNDPEFFYFADDLSGTGLKFRKHFLRFSLPQNPDVASMNFWIKNGQ